MRRLGIEFKSSSSTTKAVHSQAKPIIGSVDMKVKIGDWQGELNFTIVPVDDFKVVLGLKFFCKVHAFPIPAVKSLVVIDTSTIHVIPLRYM